MLASHYVATIFLGGHRNHHSLLGRRRAICLRRNGLNHTALKIHRLCVIGPAEASRIVADAFKNIFLTYELDAVRLRWNGKNRILHSNLHSYRCANWNVRVSLESCSFKRRLPVATAEEQRCGENENEVRLHVA